MHARRAIIALGSNIGDKVAFVANAVAMLAAHEHIKLLATSRLYRTDAWGKTDQDWFVNACVAIETTLPPEPLLDVCQGIENELGRVRDMRWGPRVIDVDILTYEGVEQQSQRLTLPHPLITERAFVLAPLKDIAPKLVIKGRLVSDWLEEVGEQPVSILDQASSGDWLQKGTQN